MLSGVLFYKLLLLAITFTHDEQVILNTVLFMLSRKAQACHLENVEE